jgi:hypothetical protein
MKKIVRKTFQMLTRDCNRPLSVKHGTLMMMMMMMMVVVMTTQHYNKTMYF